MKIIISPAKQMKAKDISIEPISLPPFLGETTELMEWMRSLSFSELKNLWGCNEKIAEQNLQRLKSMDLQSGLTPALLSYEGIQYQYMAPTVFEESMLEYVQSHLRILSGFYGVLKPLDGVTPYRLEMQAKIEIEKVKNLYEFWNKKIYEEMIEENETIINLASKEYSKCIGKYLNPNQKYITCVFGEHANGKVVQKGTYAKMARGEMVRFMAENKVENPEDIKKFNHLGYRYMETESSENSYVFIK